MIIEIEITKNILEHMIKEQELNNSKCMDFADIKYLLDHKDYDLVDEVSKEFLVTLLREYKKHKPTDYLKIKISKK